jgi:hypothetical protein
VESATVCLNVVEAYSAESGERECRKNEECGNMESWSHHTTKQQHPQDGGAIADTAGTHTCPAAMAARCIAYSVSPAAPGEHGSSSMARNIDDPAFRGHLSQTGEESADADLHSLSLIDLI